MKKDTELRRDVLDELEWEPSIDAAEIGVAAHDGVVTLTGTVKSYSEKLAAERAAKRVQGVKAVANDIEVRLPGTAERTDSDIARAAVDALKWRTLGAGRADQGRGEQGLDHPRGGGRLAVSEGCRLRGRAPPDRRDRRDQPDHLEGSGIGDARSSPASKRPSGAALRWMRRRSGWKLAMAR